MQETLAVTTRWAGLPTDGARIRRLLDYGIRAIFLHEGIRREGFEALVTLLPRGAAKALSIFAPLPDSLRPDSPPPFHMGSLRRADRDDALKQGVRALELSESRDIPFLVVPAAPMKQPSPAEVFPCLSGKTTERTWRALRQERALVEGLHLDSYMITLSRLLNLADRYGRSLLLTVAGLPCELPDVEEVQKFIREFEGAPLFLCGDTLRDSRYRLSRGGDPPELPGELRPLLRAVTVHDGDRSREHLPLGAGEVDVDLSRWKGLVTESQQAQQSAASEASETSEAPEETRFWVLDLTATTSEEDFLQSHEILASIFRSEESGPKGLLDP